MSVAVNKVPVCTQTSILAPPHPMATDAARFQQSDWSTPKNASQLRTNAPCTSKCCTGDAIVQATTCPGKVCVACVSLLIRHLFPICGVDSPRACDSLTVPPLDGLKQTIDCCFPNHDIKSEPGNPTDCCSLCAALPECAGWTHNAADGMCYLKTQMGPVRYCGTNCTSAAAHGHPILPPGPPPPAPSAPNTTMLFNVLQVRAFVPACLHAAACLWEGTCQCECQALTLCGRTRPGSIREARGWGGQSGRCGTPFRPARCSAGDSLESSRRRRRPRPLLPQVQRICVCRPPRGTVLEPLVLSGQLRAGSPRNLGAITRWAPAG